MSEIFAALAGWGVPVTVVSILGLSYLFIQIIGELIELCGKAVPEFFKVRKFIQRKRKEKKDAIQAKLEEQQRITSLLASVEAQQTEVKTLLNEVNMHYSKDNITHRNCWMREVNEKMRWVDERAQVYDAAIERLLSLESKVREQIDKAEVNGEKLDIAMQMTSQMYQDTCRNRILDFAHRLINARNEDKPVIFSREEFRKIRRTYADYEAFLERFNGTNGEVDNAMLAIQRAELGELPNIEIFED